MTPSGIKPVTFRHRVPLYEQWFPLICGQNSTLSGSRHIASCGMLFKTKNQNTAGQSATGINSGFWPGRRTAAAMWQQRTFNKHQRTLTLQIAHWRFPLTEQYVVIANYWYVTVSAGFVTNEMRSVNIIRRSDDGHGLTFKTHLMQGRCWGMLRAGDVYLVLELVLETHLQFAASGAVYRSGLLKIRNPPPS